VKNNGSQTGTQFYSQITPDYADKNLRASASSADKKENNLKDFDSSSVFVLTALSFFKTKP
jgi:hypothetical protein